MRRLLATIVVVLLLYCVTAYAAPKGELPYGAQTRLSVMYDKFEDVYTVMPKLSLLGSTFDRPQLMLFVQHDLTDKRMYMHVWLTSKTWAFLEYGIFLVNGVRYETPHFNYFDEYVHHDVVEGGINEEIYLQDLHPKTAAIIKAIVEAGLNGVVEYRFYGARNVSGTMTEGEKQAWLDMIEYYNYISSY